MSKLLKTKKYTDIPQRNNIGNRKRRHIEDVPFYKLHHGYDELPLDPVRPFILEKIRKYLKE